MGIQSCKIIRFEPLAGFRSFLRWKISKLGIQLARTSIWRSPSTDPFPLTSGAEEELQAGLLGRRDTLLDFLTIYNMETYFVLTLSNDFRLLRKDRFSLNFVLAPFS